MNTARTAPRTPPERKLTPEAIDRLTETRERIMRGRRFEVDSTAILRRLRGGYPDEPTAPDAPR